VFQYDVSAGCCSEMDEGILRGDYQILLHDLLLLLCFFIAVLIHPNDLVCSCRLNS